MRGSLHGQDIGDFGFGNAGRTSVGSWLGRISVMRKYKYIFSFLKNIQNN